MTTIHQIIQSCGGPEGIEAEAKARGSKLTIWAVKKWFQNGIPEKHWDIVMKLSGVSTDTLYSANSVLRQAEAHAS